MVDVAFLFLVLFKLCYLIYIIGVLLDLNLDFEFYIAI